MLVLRRNRLLRCCARLSLAVLICAAVAGAVVLYAGPPRLARRDDASEQKPGAADLTSAPSAAKALPDSKKHPLLPAIEIARANLKIAVALKDYTATFSKRERIGKQLIQQTMFMKFRNEPMSVYMKFLTANAGREVLYVSGQNNDQLLVHETGIRGLVGTLSFPLNHPEVMRENRHPMNQLGFVKLIELQIVNWENELKYGEVSVTISDVKLGEQSCQLIETTHPQPRQQFRFHKSRQYFDVATKLPVRVENYGFPKTTSDEPPLMEEYSYSNVQTNVGLTDRDFDRRNREYGF